MSTSTPPRTPTVAIARILRSLGLVQGTDFRVTGEYRNGERVGTYVLTLSPRSDETIAANADRIERISAEGPFPFRVSLRYLRPDRPTPGVANYGSRVRETPPTPEPVKAPAVEPTPEPEPVTTTAEAPAPELPSTDSPAGTPLTEAHQRAWGQRRAEALGWSRAQAGLMASAAFGQLQYRQGVLRYFPRPGHAGQPVKDERLVPLTEAGFLTTGEDGAGGERVRLTTDGREALRLWRAHRPAPVPKDAHMDRDGLRPLLGGELATCQRAASEEDYRHRRAEREAMYATLEELHAWEDRSERLWAAYARVQDITHRAGRAVPAGWVPTGEEITVHRLDPAVVAELRAEAEHPEARPALPDSYRPTPVELPAPTIAPDDTEQLDLFAEAS